MVSPLRAGLLARCPACGKGRLFDGLLTIVPVCSHCGFALGEHDAGDGAPYFVILVMAVTTTLLGSWAEFRFAPPLWVHVLVWSPFILLGSVGLLRLIKGLLVAYQYKHRPDLFEGS